MGLPRMHPHMLRHTFVTTMLDAAVDLRDVQIAARHAAPRTTMRYGRARSRTSSGRAELRMFPTADRSAQRETSRPAPPRLRGMVAGVRPQAWHSGGGKDCPRGRRITQQPRHGAGRS